MRSNVDYILAKFNIRTYPVDEIVSQEDMEAVHDLGPNDSGRKLVSASVDLQPLFKNSPHSRGIEGCPKCLAMRLSSTTCSGTLKHKPQHEANATRRSSRKAA